MIIVSIVSILLIILVYLQSASAKANGSSILGNENIELFENAKARGVEKVILWSTGFLSLLFFVLVIVSQVI